MLMTKHHSSEMLTGWKPKSLGTEANVLPKPLGEVDWMREFGLAIERALARAGMTKQDASFAMGYQDQSSVGKWIGGVERPHFDKLWAIESLRAHIAVEFAKLAGERVKVRTTVEIESAA